MVVFEIDNRTVNFHISSLINNVKIVKKIDK